VGLNAGEPIEEDVDLFGSTVIMASRIAAEAGVGEILIPEPRRHLLSGKSYAYADRGETMLKGFEDASACMRCAGGSSAFRRSSGIHKFGLTLATKTAS
jgi:class 3 adenylate cyclase